MMWAPATTASVAVFKDLDNRPRTHPHGIAASAIDRRRWAMMWAPATTASVAEFSSELQLPNTVKKEPDKAQRSLYLLLLIRI
jgi:hypothetical protein